MLKIQDLMKQVALTGETATASYILGEKTVSPITVIDTTATVISDGQSNASSPPSRALAAGGSMLAMPAPREGQKWSGGFHHDSFFGKAQQTLAKIKEIVVRKWNFPKKQREEPPKGSLDLAGSENFSPEMEAVLGKANVTDIYGIDDDFFQTEIFESVTENVALRGLRNGSTHTLQPLLDAAQHDFRVKYSLEFDGKLPWLIGSQNAKGTCLVELIGRIFTISRLDALATLADMVGIKLENITRLSSESHVAEERNVEPQDEIPRFLLLPRRNGFAELIKLEKIKGHSGQTMGAIALYRYDKTIFGLPATVGRRTLSIGTYKPTAFWLNQHYMDTHPCVPVVICQDIRAALAFSEILAESLKGNGLAVIVTGHLFDDLSILPWNYLWGHDVVFVPAPNKACMAMVKIYQKYSLGAGAKNFKVATRVLLHSKPGQDLNSPINLELEGSEAELVRNAFYIDDIERPAWFANQLLADSIPCDEFIRRGQEAGIFKRPKQTGRLDGQNQNQGGDLKIFEIEAVATTMQPTCLSGVTLAEILPAGGIVMVHGSKNAGKSTLIFALLRALLSGGAAFGFLAENVSGVAVLLDSETPTGLFKERIVQYGLASAIGLNFFPIAKNELQSDGVHPSLTDAAFRSRLENQIRNVKADYIFLDNLTTWSDPGTIYQQQAVGEILDWVASLSAKGVITVMVHHSHEPGGKRPEGFKMRGSGEFSIRAHTEIVVIGREQIIEDETLGTDEVQEAARTDGATIGIHFKYCKMACVLEGHTLWFHLPLNGAGTWNLLSITGRGGEPIEIGSDKLTPAPNEAPYLGADADGASNALDPTGSANIPTDSAYEGNQDNGLSEDEVKVMEFTRKNGKIKVKDVCKLLGCQETKAREILNAMVDSGRLKKLEKNQGCPTIYGLAD